MKMKLSSLVAGLLGLVALAAVAASPAQAAFVVGGEQGWQMSFDGMINVFAVYDSKSQRQLDNGTIVSPSPADELQSFRVRTGLLPSIFAFNVKSPTINGVDYGARIGIYPQIENATTHTGLGPGTFHSGTAGGTSVDFREIFFTADGCFGQVLAGRALNLFQGKNILTDMTLIGLGVPLNMTGLGVSTGYIGRGYTYASFGPQFRYTTPDMKGLKWALEIADPSKIDGATAVNQPRFETEFSYAGALGGAKLNTWLSGIYQEAKFNSNLHKVSSMAGAMGVQVMAGPVEALVSGFGGKGIGAFLTQDGGDSLDSSGKERITMGGLAHVTFQAGPAKIGAQYGINYSEKQGDANAAAMKSNQAATGGVYYSVNKYLTLVGEYTWTRTQWWDSSKQDQHIIDFGTVFVW